MLKVLSLLSIILMIIAISVPTHGEADWSPTKTNVRVENQLGTNVFIHCKSSDSDLGDHNVFNNDFVEWSFRANIRGTTSFSCALFWGDNVHQSIVIYDAKIDESLCISKCLRVLKPDGAYFYHQYKDSWEKRYSW
ncbi:unnamed protein product [Vicia faba]|uniref:S-protein homolog n=1 Tax=Vicia faba TaxID=3906 RepID=A0AAV1BC55_VICFA|nr:unnamed protein product [Vicia faba]